MPNKNFKKVNQESFDYHYWKNNGWLDENASYYYDPETNFIKRVLARLLSKSMGLIPI